MFSPYFNCYYLHPVLIYSELFWSLIVLADQITQYGLSLVKSIYWFNHYYLVFVAHRHGTHATVKGIFPSLGAHSACQLSTADIRKTWEWATNTFHRVQQSTILAGMATRNKLWILVNTDEITWMLVAIMFCHQVPMILLGPSRWTVISGRHHQHRATWLDEADNTWCFMIMEIFLKKGFRCDHLLHIQCRTCIRSSDGHLCTCHTLDCVEGRGSSLHHLGECNALHPLYLMQGKSKIGNLTDCLNTKTTNHKWL